jgi:F0F1-type ATP synthase assembly protein I
MANSTGTRQRDEERGLSQTAADVKNKAKDAASSVAEKARDVASSVAGQAKDVASGIGERASEATTNVGSGMQSLAGTIRDKAPHEGMVGAAASSVANALESGGKYLQEQGLGGMGRDLTNLIRRNPIPAMLVGVGIGYLLARATRS